MEWRMNDGISAHHRTIDEGGRGWDWDDYASRSKTDD